MTAVEGKALMHCHGHCPKADVLAALGLSPRDLFNDDGRDTYKYDDGRTVTRTMSPNGGKRFRQTNTSGTPTLYRLDRVRAAVAAGEPVWLVEGEKDVHALEREGVTATTAPQGASNVNKCDLAPLHGARVVAVVDRDPAGDGWAQKVRADY